METFIAILAIILGIVGIIGSVAPGLPGPPLSWLGMMLLYFWGGGADKAGTPMGTRLLLIWLAVTIAVTVLDYIVPAYFTKASSRRRTPPPPSNPPSAHSWASFSAPAPS